MTGEEWELQSLNCILEEFLEGFINQSIPSKGPKVKHRTLSEDGDGGRTQFSI